MKKGFYLLLLFSFICSSYVAQTNYNMNNWKLSVSPDGRFLQKQNGAPFFWLGDTGWLLFKKLNRNEAENYLEDRHQKGFNVIQVMIIHSNPATNVYGDSAFVNNDPTKPKVTNGNDPNDSLQYDFWDHVDYILDKAAEKGIYLALVPVWGSNVKAGFINKDNCSTYAEWLAKRYRDKPNIIWLNGGDIKGNENLEVWNKIGNTLKKSDSNHLITFHPFGRMQSSLWFHNEQWLDFNMFQSGHKRYSQDTNGYGEDNWKYVADDREKIPHKPVIDSEPSYENIPQGLHDSAEVRWKDKDVRRYAYWSVFSGAFGHTYGNNSVMQFHKPSDSKGAYGVTDYWFNEINSPGAKQIKYLKNLMLSRPFLELTPDQSIIEDSIGTRYNHLAAARGKDYMLIYSYNCRTFKINPGKISGDSVSVHWYNPRNGECSFVGKFKNNGIMKFNSPCIADEGNDWVLVIDDTKKCYPIPGVVLSYD